MQQLVLDFEVLDLDECISATTEASRSISLPAREIERLGVGLLMLRVAVALVWSLHERLGGPRSCACDRLLAKLAIALAGPAADAPQHALAGWLAEFGAAYRASHPGGVANEAAAIVRRQPAEPWTIARLAERVGCSSRVLSRAFRSEFGVTVHRYLGIARLLSVYDRLATGQKLSAIADDAGYRSPKDFYRVVRDCTGLTPRALGSLTAGARAGIERLLRSALVRQRPAPGRRTPRGRRSPIQAAMLLATRGSAIAERVRPIGGKPAKATLRDLSVRRSKSPR